MAGVAAAVILLAVAVASQDQDDMFLGPLAFHPFIDNNMDEDDPDLAAMAWNSLGLLAGTLGDDSDPDGVLTGISRREALLSLLGRGPSGEKIAPEEIEELPRNQDEIPESLWSGFFPGTKWCGPGTRAGWDNDLGINRKTDNCCRQHDHCQESIGPHKCLHGICNNSTTFTMSHCDCDDEFRSCLQQARTPVADQVGFLYFNLGQMKCFALRPPVTKCLKLSGPLHGRCEVYEFDRNRPQQWQLLDQPRYMFN